MLNDRQIEAAVRGQLAADPRLERPEEIAVDARSGVVTLRGTVGSFAQRLAALEDARRTPDVLDLYDEVQVRLLGQRRRRDAEIRGAALQRLIWDAEVPSDRVEVHVKDGWVTLRGRVDFQFQSQAAFDAVANVHGVTGVTDEIDVAEPSVTREPRLPRRATIERTGRPGST
jgi:osmotically-inducible protein OsmY